MKTLYLDNYKGFVNSYIPFYDVNFFVGENSTGKTAILNLLDLLSSPRFWIVPEFNTDVIELGYFDEIVNSYSKDRSYFTIGIEGKEKKGKNSKRYFWMKFKRRNALPLLSEYMSIIEDKSVLVSLNGKSIKYQLRDFQGESFQEWVEARSTFTTPKKRISQPFTNIPFAIIRGLVLSEIKGNPELDKPSEALFGPTFNNNFYSLAPIRARAQRSYEAFRQNFSREGDHIPNVLREIYSHRDKNEDSKFEEALTNFGKESGLFDSISIDAYGKSKGSPFTINVLYNSLRLNITNVGYGVSQVMPLLVEIITSKGDTFSIQQPEVHLHPRAQAAFGELLYTSAVENKNKFFVETHSEYTINRFRYKLNKSTEKATIKSQVLFFERTETGTHATSLEFNEMGQHIGELPDAYSKFFIDEELKMLEI